MRVVEGSRSPVSPFGSAVALDPARRVPRNDQPAPLAVLGGCRPGHDLDTRQVRPGCLLFRPRPVGFVPLPEHQPPPIFRRQDRILAGVARPQLQPPVTGVRNAGLTRKPRQVWSVKTGTARTGYLRASTVRRVRAWTDAAGIGNGSPLFPSMDRWCRVKQPLPAIAPRKRGKHSSPAAYAVDPDGHQPRAPAHRDQASNPERRRLPRPSQCTPPHHRGCSEDYCALERAPLPGPLTPRAQGGRQGSLTEASRSFLSLLHTTRDLTSGAGLRHH